MVVGRHALCRIGEIVSRAVVFGAAGFLGSHLVDLLLERDTEVIGVDNLCTGSLNNLSHLESHHGFTFIRGDICEPLELSKPVDVVFNLASPASPPKYQQMPIETLRAGSLGTERSLQFASKKNARYVMASTSEVYGDPVVSPQKESYWGNVNPNGLRSCYDEAKRYSEALCMAYCRQEHVNVGIARIFNTYGPRLDPNDGRVVSNFISQALRGEPITIYGDGTQTRSFCYVSDQIRGLVALSEVASVGPINIGNPTEHTMNDLAAIIREMVGSENTVRYEPLPQDDPLQRRPDITLAQDVLKWEPEVDLRSGLSKTIEWFRRELAANQN